MLLYNWNCYVTYQISFSIKDHPNHIQSKSIDNINRHYKYFVAFTKDINYLIPNQGLAEVEKKRILRKFLTYI